jgi:hypothetical protein
LLDLNRDGIPDLVVASRLGNDILIYPGLPDGSFGPPTSFPVGFEPVAFTARDLNGDGVLDLAVANQGSNDVSILLGSIDPTTGLWRATPGPRLKSGGSEPIAVQAGHFLHSDILDLRVTNRDGRIAIIPGIGSNGQGTGFFNDTNPQLTSLGSPIVQAVFDRTTGQEFVVRGDGGIDALDGTTFTPIFTPPPGQGVSTLDAADGLLTAGFEDGSVGLLTEGGKLLAEDQTGFTDQPSALRALQDGNVLDVFLTFASGDAPLLVTFPIALAEVPHAAAVAQATALPQADLVLVATLLTGGLVEGPPPAAAEAPAAEAFVLFLPPLQAHAAAADNGNAGDGDEAPEGVVPNRVDQALPRWQAFTLGLDQQWRQRQFRQQTRDTWQNVLDALEAVFDQLDGLLRPPAGIPNPTGQEVVPPRDAPLPDAAGPGVDAAEVPPEEGPAGSSEGEERDAEVQDAEVFAYPELLPAPQRLARPLPLACWYPFLALSGHLLPDLAEVRRDVNQELDPFGQGEQGNDRNRTDNQRSENH